MGAAVILAHDHVLDGLARARHVHGVRQVRPAGGEGKDGWVGAGGVRTCTAQRHRQVDAGKGRECRLTGVGSGGSLSLQRKAAQRRASTAGLIVLKHATLGATQCVLHTGNHRATTRAPLDAVVVELLLQHLVRVVAHESWDVVVLRVHVCTGHAGSKQ